MANPKLERNHFKTLIFCGILALVLTFHAIIPQARLSSDDEFFSKRFLQSIHDDEFNETLCDTMFINEVPVDEQCAFVTLHCQTELNDSRIPYLLLPFCALPSQKWLAYIVLILLVLLAFYLLGVVADRFFLPSLSAVSNALNLPPSVAGVTLLGWGNGAPDISSTYANIQGEKYSQSFGQLIGAGMFVGIAISAIVVMIKATEVKRRPFLRDIGFFILTICSVFFVCYDHSITVFESVIWMSVYIAYVLFVVVGRFVYTKTKAGRQYELLRREQARLITLGQALPSDHPIFTQPRDLSIMSSDDLEKYIVSVVRAIETNDALADGDQDSEESETKRTTLEGVFDHMNVSYLTKIGYWDPDLRRKVKANSDEAVTLGNQIQGDIPLDDATAMGDVDPLDTDLVDLDQIYDHSNTPSQTKWKNFLGFFEWEATSVAERIWDAVTAPLLLIIHLIIPWLEEDKYSRILYCCHPIAIAFFFCFLFNDYWNREFIMTNGTHLGLAIYWVLPISIFLSALVFFTTNNDRPPIYAPVFTFASIVLSALVISCIANELVTVLGALGICWHIYPAVMGLTVLAWGNSVGDLMSNVIIARKGFPQMAIGACFSAPLTNLLIGLGLAFFVKTLSVGPVLLDPSKEAPDLSNTHYVGLFFLLGVLVITLIVVPVCSFTFPRVYGGFLMFVYVVFLVVSILLAFGLILPDIILWNY